VKAGRFTNIFIGMAIFLSVVLFSGGLYIIIKGGDVLVDAALRLSRTSGINQVVIGATFVSVATTLPEVFVSIFAVAAGNQGIAVGNAVGSMICNVALVLALYIMFLPTRVSRRSIYGKSVYLFAVTFLVFLFTANLKIGWIEGAVLLVLFSFFLFLNIKEAGDAEVVRQTVVRKSGDVRNIVAGFLAGQVMLVIGAFLLVDHGERLAGILGISETVVGLTAIAVGTSMPELITCITSIRRKSGGLALGNVIGSNIISCTLLLGTCAVLGDLRGTFLVSRSTFLVSIPFLFLVYIVAIVPMILQRKTSRWQGAALLALYVLYVGYLIISQPV
jgi:cation:H+ antiporter